MFRLSGFRKKIILTLAICMFGISQVFADASNCRTGSQGDHIDLSVNFDLTSNTTAITPGTTLASKSTGMFGMTCDFTGEGAANNIYFRSSMSENIRSMLTENGVEIFQRYAFLGGAPDYNITQPGHSDILLSFWNQPEVGVEVGFISGYIFTVKKGGGDLKPFDTGVFQLGYHVNEERQNIGLPIYARFVGNLVLLCPTPKVDITASNGGSVNFGAVEPRSLYDGNQLSKNFNLNMAVTPDCETGLNISVRFEPNNNTVLDNKNLDMDNGLQVLLSNSNGDINYNEQYYIGEVLPFTPVNQSYTATLSHIPGSNIVSGPFSKTIRVVVSY